MPWGVFTYGPSVHRIAWMIVSGARRRADTFFAHPPSSPAILARLRLERPNPCTPALFVSLKGPARGRCMTPAGMRSLFRYHRQTTGVALANPHRFRHTFASDMCGPAPACQPWCNSWVMPTFRRSCDMCRSPDKTFTSNICLLLARAVDRYRFAPISSRICDRNAPSRCKVSRPDETA